MKLEITALGFEMTPGLKQYIEHRTRFGFSKFSGLGPYIHITLFHSGETRGDGDVCVHLYVSVPGIKKVVINEEQPELYRAVDRAVDQAQRVVARKLSRKREIFIKPFTGRPMLDPLSGPALALPAERV